MRVAIIVASLSGNTTELAGQIASAVRELGVECELFPVERVPRPLPYALVFFGSYTWGEGELPASMRQELRRLLVEEAKEKHAAPSFSHAAVFGTGDTQFRFFCRAVDEMAYHLRRHAIQVVGEPLRVEQRGACPQRIAAWTQEIIGGMRGDNAAD